MKKAQEIYFDRELKFDNAVVKVFRHVLTDEERARRMKELHNASAALLKDVMKNKAKRKEEVKKYGT